MNHVDTEDLKKHIDVNALLEHYKLEKVEDAGEWVKALCPYHVDGNPSFTMRKSDTFFHCWSCPAKGDAIALVMHLEKCTFPEATSKLASISGYSVDDDSRMTYLRSKWMKADDVAIEKDTFLIENPRLYKLSRWATAAFSKFYATSKAKDYLAGRGFSDEDAKRFDLGYYPTSGFTDMALNAGATEAELTALGFLTPYGERFSHRLMFPIYNVNREVSAFSGRGLEEGQEPKYTATPTSDYYKKGLFLYGLQNVRAGEPIVLVEGNLDCVRLACAGVNTLAQLGTALTASQCKLLKTLTHQVILMMDGDEAGQRALYKGILPLIEAGIDVKVIALPDGEDPDTCYKQIGKERFSSMFADLCDGLKYYVNSPFSASLAKTALLSTVLASFKRMPESDIKNKYVTQCANIWGYSEQSIKIELRKQ